ncbi:MAG: hypothetical protein PF569_06845, partial [Candidatus Woesearchaeota archaeon]|nr:hypothetical protein [Candidatus Woesearchaeota archaeon]
MTILTGAFFKPENLNERKINFLLKANSILKEFPILYSIMKLDSFNFSKYDRNIIYLLAYGSENEESQNYKDLTLIEESLKKINLNKIKTGIKKEVIARLNSFDESKAYKMVLELFLYSQFSQNKLISEIKFIDFG